MCRSYSLYRCSELLGLGRRRDMNMILSALEESNPQPKLKTTHSSMNSSQSSFSSKDFPKGFCVNVFIP